MILSNCYAKDDRGRIIPACAEEYPDRVVLHIPKAQVSPDASRLYVLDGAFTASAGEAGYYVGNNDFGRHTAFLTYFTEREDFDYYSSERIRLLNMFGVKTSSGTFVAVVTGMPYDHQLHIQKQGDTYRIGLFYDLTRVDLYEDIVIQLLKLPPDATYVDMAKRYRAYQLSEGGCKPLRERVRERPQLAYVKDAVEIRVRLGWKPAPPEIEEQTEENEPPMHVACTFSRVRDLIDELKRQGVEKAEICLVGWNKSGHDGRWPTAFPVEPLLGGEEQLRGLIQYAQENGYKIVCHSNSTECYHISGYFQNGAGTIKKKNGETGVTTQWWSGGKPYWLCPQRAFEIAGEILPKIADLGFSGLHYIDVISVVEPRSCFDKNHPCNAGQTVAYYEKIMQLSQKLFGGFASEGGFDCYAKYLDYGLYVRFNRKREVCMDEGIPFWEIAYHGIIMGNLATNTVNYTLKTPEDRLQQIEGGGRPAFYFYSKFVSNGSDWMGREDLTADTDEALCKSVSHIKQGYDEYQALCHLQTEFIEDYQRLAAGVSETTYSDGTRILVNYSKEAYTDSDGHVVQPKGYLVLQ